MTYKLKDKILERVMSNSRYFRDNGLQFVGYCGLTKIVYKPGIKYLFISHSGSMGNDIKTIQKNLNSFFGFDILKKCELKDVSGTPDYYWEGKIDLTVKV